MRRPLDQYHTNEYLTRTLLKHTDIYGSILEPCAGKGHISSILKELPNAQVIENDIDPSMGFAYVDDATIMCAKIWGRSCIETRTTDNCLEHRLSQESEALKGRE